MYHTAKWQALPNSHRAMGNELPRIVNHLHKLGKKPTSLPIVAYMFVTDLSHINK